MNRLYLLTALLSVAWISLAQQTPMGELVVAGTTDWPTAEIRIFANGNYYRCNRDPVRGTLCRAQLPRTTNAVRVEMEERGVLPFSKNFANIQDGLNRISLSSEYSKRAGVAATVRHLGLGVGSDCRCRFSVACSGRSS